jgi:hypothetical protein
MRRRLRIASVETHFATVRYIDADEKRRVVEVACISGVITVSI